MSDLWLAAGEDAERDRYQHHLAMARTAAADSMAFALGAATPEEFEHRLALVSGSFDAAVATAVGDSNGFLDVRVALLDEVNADFGRIHAAREAEAAAERQRIAARRQAEAEAARKVALNAQFAKIASDMPPCSECGGSGAQKRPFPGATCPKCHGSGVDVSELLAERRRLKQEEGSSKAAWSEDDDEFDDSTPEECPVCDGPGRELGTLGNLTHYRCEDCGNEWSEDYSSDGRYPQADDLSFESARTAKRYQVWDNAGPKYTPGAEGILVFESDFFDLAQGRLASESEWSGADGMEFVDTNPGAPHRFYRGPGADIVVVEGAKTAAKDDEGDDSCPECHADWKQPHDEDCERGRKQGKPGWIVDKKEATWSRTKVAAAERQVPTWTTEANGRDLVVIAINQGFTWAVYADGDEPLAKGRTAKLELAQALAATAAAG